MAESVCSLKILSPLGSEMIRLLTNGRIKHCPERHFFTVIYRSPMFNHPSPEFVDFLSNFNNLNSDIKNENLHASFLCWGF